MTIHPTNGPIEPPCEVSIFGEVDKNSHWLLKNNGPSDQVFANETKPQPPGENIVGFNIRHFKEEKFFIKNEKGFLQVSNSSWIDGKEGIGLVTTAMEVGKDHNYLWTFIPDSKNKFYRCKLDIRDDTMVDAALELYLCVSNEENNDGFLIKVGQDNYARKAKTQKWIFVNSDKKPDEEK
jgi:hypothetical protein